ncbi:MAG: hypothetical protein IIU80_00290 [Clostridia bacterium]|nr:hypothetical protein [Clostridia bacterium]
MSLKSLKNVFIFISVIVVIIAGFAFIRNYDASPKLLKEWHHVTEISELEGYLKGIQAESCDGYWYVHTHDFFGYEAAFSGEIKITEEYYNEIREKYDDWEERTGWPAEANAIGYRDNIRSFSCDNFKNFVNNETYLMSETYNQDLTTVLLLSKDSPTLYMYFYTDR